MIGDLPLVPLVFLGALLALDVVSFPQAMISRPLVAGTLGGLVAGDVLAGLMVGTVLELIALETLPVGASRYPEWGSASVVAGAIFASLPSIGPGTLAMSVLAGIAVAWVGGWSMYLLRLVNGVLARREEARGPVSAESVVRLQLAGLGADFVRGVIVTLLALMIVPVAVNFVLVRWGTAAELARAVVVGVAIATGAAATWRLFAATRGAIPLFSGGILLGLLLLGLR